MQKKGYQRKGYTKMDIWTSYETKNTIYHVNHGICMHELLNNPT